MITPRLVDSIDRKIGLLINELQLSAVNIIQQL
jgi:hypothetical protein